MRLAGVIGDGDDHLRALARNGGHRRALTQVNPLGHQTAAQHVDQHRIVLDQIRAISTTVTAAPKRRWA